jgi:hypothetical protein
LRSVERDDEVVAVGVVVGVIVVGGVGVDGVVVVGTGVECGVVDVDAAVVVVVVVVKAAVVVVVEAAVVVVVEGGVDVDIVVGRWRAGGIGDKRSEVASVRRVRGDEVARAIACREAAVAVGSTKLSEVIVVVGLKG